MKSDKKIDEAKRILAALGMPKQQQTDNAAFTLLAFANIRPRTPWSDASDPRLKPHDVIEFAWAHYSKKYAENTRETIRRQAIHQFVQGAVLSRNPDDPGLATNSPRTHYALTSEALAVIQQWGGSSFETRATAFRSDHGLAERYAKGRKAATVPVAVDDLAFELSPGQHNELQKQVVSEFRKQFAKGAQLLYLGDTDHKSTHVDKAALRTLGIVITGHDKLPDVLLWDQTKNWLYLIEAVTTHGPVSPTRLVELEDMLRNCRAGRVYVSAFLSFRDFKKWAAQIAWETEVWIAERPEHMLHYNGDRFLGPR